MMRAACNAVHFDLRGEDGEKIYSKPRSGYFSDCIEFRSRSQTSMQSATFHCGNHPAILKIAHRVSINESGARYAHEKGSALQSGKSVRRSGQCYSSF
jgi:hypothetical protein